MNKNRIHLEANDEVVATVLVDGPISIQSSSVTFLVITKRGAIYQLNRKISGSITQTRINPEGKDYG